MDGPPIPVARTCAVAAVLAVAAAILAPLPAQAEPSGLYGAVGGLYAMPADHKSIPVALPVGDAAHDLGMESGAGGLGAVGYVFANRWRGEVELGYRSADMDHIDGWTGAYDNDPILVAGGFRTLSVMANAYYRFADDGFVPYVGAGIGMARHRVEGKSRTIKIGDVSGHFTFEGRETVAAWQAMAGLARSMAENVELRLGYRFFRTRSGRFGPDVLGFRTHDLEVGLTFMF